MLQHKLHVLQLLNIDHHAARVAFVQIARGTTMAVLELLQQTHQIGVVASLRLPLLQVHHIYNMYIA